MRLIVYSDLQATESGDQCFNSPGTDLQLFRVQAFFAKLKNLYTEFDCEGIVDLGDTFDDRSAIGIRSLDTVLAGLEQIPAGAFSVKLIGNHDQFLRNGSIHNGRIFKPRFTVPDANEIIDLEGTLIFLASYPDEHSKLTQWLDTESLRHRQRRKILLGHFQMVGATLQGGTEAVLGVPRNIVERFDLTLLGHIHLPQSLGKRIHYVGSPFEQNWGEAGQSKRVAVLDTKTLSVKWLPLTGFPVHRRGSLKEFEAQFDPASEDRWKVELRNHADSERFYAMPESVRYEAVYAYDTQDSVQNRDEPPTDWSLGASLDRWVKTVPPANYGIELQPEEVVEIGRQLVT